MLSSVRKGTVPAEVCNSGPCKIAHGREDRLLGCFAVVSRCDAVALGPKAECPVESALDRMAALDFTTPCLHMRYVHESCACAREGAVCGRWPWRLHPGSLCSSGVKLSNGSDGERVKV
jgi:hypothetical protein